MLMAIGLMILLLAASAVCVRFYVKKQRDLQMQPESSADQTGILQKDLQESEPSSNKNAVTIAVSGALNRRLEARVGESLLECLGRHDLFLHSACGGQGSCGICKVQILSGAESFETAELEHLTEKERLEGFHLACRLKIQRDLTIALDPSILQARRYKCTVLSNENVATYVKKLVLKLPDDALFEYRAGSYMQLEAPPHEVAFSDFDIPELYREDWRKHHFLELKSQNSERSTRAYSLANKPDERGILVFTVRIATPPMMRPHAPPGSVSSYLFSLKKGAEISAIGPFGDFFVKDSPNEMIFVGGGAGMAPMRAHLFDQLERLQTKRKVSFWYGARCLKEAFFLDELNALCSAHPGFSWHLILSRPAKTDPESYPKGFVHQALYDLYLKKHPDPRQAEFYLCGPPMMVSAMTELLDRLGVPKENVLFDNFG